MPEELAKELEQRGSAEISNGVVNQITQALDEKETEATFLMFGEIKTESIISIDEACAKCPSLVKDDTVEECQERQGKDARARGFTRIICPRQFGGWND